MKTLLARLGQSLIAATVAFGCTTAERRNDFEPLVDADAATEVVIAGLDWQAEASLGRDCLRVRIESTATPCASLSFVPDSSGIGVWHSSDRSFVYVIAGDQGVRLRLESSGRTGDIIETVDVGEVAVAVVELGQSEEPWGVQLLDADGALIRAQSLIP